jgi:hypothetical protein
VPFPPRLLHPALPHLLLLARRRTVFLSRQWRTLR